MNTNNIMAALEAQAEILSNATAVKGQDFVAKARIAFATSQLNAIAQHMATCHDPQCSAGMAGLAELHAAAISKVIAENMNTTDQEELVNLCKRMAEQAQIASKA